MIIRFALYSTLAIVLLSDIVLADNLFVPSQFATIQAAMDAAVAGDHVVVTPGIHSGPGNVNLNFNGKAITVRGVAPMNPGIVGETIIDGQGTARGFSLFSGETTDSVIDGLTIMNGGGGSGSGINVFLANGSLFTGVTVRNCLITQCTNGAIKAGPRGALILDNCRIINNSGGQFLAGGVNTGYLTTVRISNCTISDNTEGGLNLLLTDLIMTDCVVENNTGILNLNGGGMLYNQGMNQAVIRRCRFVGNHAPEKGGGILFYIANVPCLIESCLIVGNTAGEQSGGASNSASFNGSFLYQNCTIAGNSAPQASGCFNVAANGQNRTTLNSCVVWGNQGGAQIEGNQTVAYCNVQGGFAGAGNIDADTLFVSPADIDYHLAPGSPCIESGDPTVLPAEDQTDLDGDPRLIASRVDQGAYEFSLVPGLAGDLNCDNAVDLSDLPGFVQALLDADGLVGCDADRADMNESGGGNGLDIPLFVALLLPG